MTPPDVRHTAAELEALLRLIPSSVRDVAVGHGRDGDGVHRAAAEAFVTAWEATGRTVTAVVDWPEEAASWLRPARRLTAGAPDAWVVAGAPPGWARMSRRLAQSTDWAAERTYAFASLDSPHLAELAGASVLDGLRGATADGGTWQLDDGRRTHWPPPAPVAAASAGGPVLGPDGRRRCPWAAGHPLNLAYHDSEWGLPVHGEQALFERITLEAFQAGLSWLTILAKRPAFRAAFDGFVPEKVAAYTDADVLRLMADAGIVRNRAKIEATVRNARAVLALRGKGGLDRLIWSHRPAETPRPHTAAEVPTSTPGSKALARELRAHGFGFVGPTTSYALMEAIGMVDTHLVECHRRGSALHAAAPAGG